MELSPVHLHDHSWGAVSTLGTMERCQTGLVLKKKTNT
jgi:hypothetical protein